MALDETQIQNIFGTIFICGSFRSFPLLCLFVSFCIISWKCAPCENFLFLKTNNDKCFCSGKIITLIAEMARVAQVQHANFACEYHWHILRSKNNICSCPLHLHPSHTYEAQCNTRTTISNIEKVKKGMPSY